MYTINHSLKCKNLSAGRPSVEGICLHDTAGTGTHSDTLYLVNDPENRKISVDFTVEGDGSIYQLNPDLDKFHTNHCGRATRFVNAKGVKFLNNECTRRLIGIELCQNVKTVTWSDDQVSAAAYLCVYLAQKYGLPKTAITTHAAIITDHSRTDPRQFPFDWFWNKFAFYAGQTEAADTLTASITYTVKAGDSLWSIAKRFNTSIEEIKALNHLVDMSNVIHPDQVLTVKK